MLELAIQAAITCCLMAGLIRLIWYINDLQRKLQQARELLSRCVHGVSVIDRCGKCPTGARQFKLYERGRN